MIHVCYGMTDKNGKFTKYPATSICSVFENTHSEVMIHFLHDSTLTDSNRDKLIALTEKYNQSIKFYNIDEIFADRITMINQTFDSISKKFQWAVASLYRLFMPEILDIPKAIWLDADIIFNLDIAELWQIDMKNFPLAAKAESNTFPNESPYDRENILNAIDIFKLSPKKLCDELHIVRREDYFNAGVLIFNLDLIRKIFSDAKMTLMDKALEILTKYPLEFIDNDALNFMFSKAYLHLPAKFNVFIFQSESYFGLMKIPYRIEHWSYHYSGYPMGFRSQNPFHELWMRYFLKTPSFDTQTIFNLVEDFRMQLDEERIRFQQFHKFASMENIAIFAFSQDIPALQRLNFKRGSSGRTALRSFQPNPP